MKQRRFKLKLRPFRTDSQPHYSRNRMQIKGLLWLSSRNSDYWIFIYSVGVFSSVSRFYCANDNFIPVIVAVIRSQEKMYDFWKGCHAKLSWILHFLGAFLSMQWRRVIRSQKSENIGPKIGRKSVAMATEIIPIDACNRTLVNPYKLWCLGKRHHNEFATLANCAISLTSNLSVRCNAVLYTKKMEPTL